MQGDWEYLNRGIDMSKQKIDPAAAHQTMMVLWFALLASQLIFPLVVFLTKPELFSLDLSRPLLGKNAVVIVALAAVSGLLFLVSFVMRRKYLDQAVGQQNVFLVQTALIVGCALCEAISLAGLFLAFSFDY